MTTALLVQSRIPVYRLRSRTKMHVSVSQSSTMSSMCVCVIGQQGQLLVLHSIVFLAGDICHISVSLRSRRQKIKSCSIQFVDIFQYVSTPPLSIHRIWTLDTILKMKHRHSASDLTFSFCPFKSIKCERIIDCSDNMIANEL